MKVSVIYLKQTTNSLNNFYLFDICNIVIRRLILLLKQ